MADTFYHEPNVGSDANIWGPYMLMQARVGGRGGLSMELLNTGGALHLSAGYAGIDDGTVKGTVERTADAALSLAGVSAGNWAAIELSIVAGVPTYTISDIAGGDDEWTIPASVKVAYDYMKGGYYLIASKRLIGIAFKTAFAGVLSRVVNCECGKRGFKNVRNIRYVDAAGVETNIYNDTKIIEIGDWNMDSTSYIQIPIPLWDMMKIRKFSAYVYSDSPPLGPIDLVVNGGLVPLFTGMPYLNGTLHMLQLFRVVGGMFDNASYDSTGYNRGFVVIDYDT